MGYYQYTKTEFENLIKECIKTGTVQISEENISKITNELFTKIVSEEFNDDLPINETQETNAQLYMLGKHIKIHDLIVDSFYKIFKNPELLLNVINNSFNSNFNNLNQLKLPIEISILVSSLFKIISFIKEYIINLDNDEFCVYFQAFTHYGEKHSFSIEDVKNWTSYLSQCNMKNKRWCCPYLIDSKKCNKDKIDFEKIIDKLQNKKIFIKNKETGEYLINV